MKLIQAKVRGTGALIESGWFQLSSGLNRFQFTNSHEGTLFLRSLQTLNPIFSSSGSGIFNDLPLYEKRGNYLRHIHAEKRTVALGVFAANSNLVGELGELDNNLYETDRIEVGRRLDHSRWMNFVELSSSTRWKEIKRDMQQLIEDMPANKMEMKEEAINYIENLADADRIKGQISRRLLLYLDNLGNVARTQGIFPETIALIQRADRFLKAREIVFDRLPLLIYFNSEGNISSQPEEGATRKDQNHTELHQFANTLGLSIPAIHTNSIIERIHAGIEFAVSLSNTLSRVKPIFLFDSPEKHIAESKRDNLLRLIEETATTYQCCYLLHRDNIFSSSTKGKVYTDTELQSHSRSRAVA